VGARVNGELGNGTLTGASSPSPVGGISGASTVAAEAAHPRPQLTGGAPGVGPEQRGQLGDGTLVSATTPVAVLGR
jgi:hypothetical protein